MCIWYFSGHTTKEKLLRAQHLVAQVFCVWKMAWVLELTQYLDTIRRPEAYFSKQLGAYIKDCQFASGLWLQPFTRGWKTNPRHTPHHALPLLEQNSGCGLTSGRWGKDQGTPLDILNVTLQALSTLNPATLLPRTTGEPAHNCIQITEDLSWLVSL